MHRHCFRGSKIGHQARRACSQAAWPAVRSCSSRAGVPQAFTSSLAELTAPVDGRAPRWARQAALTRMRTLSRRCAGAAGVRADDVACRSLTANRSKRRCQTSLRQRRVRRHAAERTNRQGNCARTGPGVMWRRPREVRDASADSWSCTPGARVGSDRCDEPLRTPRAWPRETRTR